MLRVLALTTALLLTPVAAHAAPASSSAAEAEFNVLLGKLADYSGSHQAALSAAADLIGLTLTGIEKAEALATDRAGRAEVNAEMDAWEAQMRANIDALNAAKAALPPFPTQTFERLALQAPSYRGKAGAYARVKVEALKAIDASIDFAQRSMGPARRAAGGDAEAMMEVAVELISGMKLILLSENAMLEVSIAAGQPEHPQTALAKSILASNSAAALILDYQVAIVLGEAGDPKVVGAAIRAKAAEARAAARQAIPLADAMGRAMRQSGAPSDIASRMLKILDSYTASSDVEVKIADALDAVAVMIEDQEQDSEKLDRALAPVEALTTRRLEIQAQRISLLRP